MKFFLLFVIQIVFVVPAWTQTPEQLIKKSGIPLQHFSIWIEGDEDNKPYALQADEMKIPASLSKIPTAATVLSELGLGFQFETKVWSSKPIDNESFDGDLYLQGGGDPSLVSENFWLMVNELKRSGLKSLRGQLYVDSSLFDEEHFSESRQSVRVDRAYDAPVSALSFNWNSVNVYVRPSRSGGKAAVFADPANDYIELKNEVVTTGSTQLQVERRSQKNHDVLVVRGTIAKNAVEQVVYKSITHPDLWAGENFKSFLNQQGIEYKGTILNKKVPASATLVVVQKSKPLREIVADMDKFSNNYVAEMLTKSLSEQKPASLRSGVARIEKWLIKKGWDSKKFIFKNPSGFSHDNRFRARDLGELLVSLRNDFVVGPEFLVSLPIAGIDGTLKKRFKKRPADVRAKTGYLDGIIGLAGYYQKNGASKAFVMMYNGPTKYDSQVRDLFDDMVP